MAEDEKEPESRDDVIAGFDREIGRAHAVLQGRDTDDGDPAPDTPATTAPESATEPPAEEAQPPAKPDTEPEAAPPAPGAAQEPAEAKPDTEPKAPPEPATPPAEPEDDTPILTFEGQTFKLADLRDPERRKAYLAAAEELHKSGLRQDNYTRQTMALADQRRALEADRRLRERVVEKILTDDQAQEYVRTHGRLALRALLSDPKSGLAVLEDPDQLQRLWKQSDAIAANPELADQLVSRQEAEAARSQLHAYTERDELLQLATEIHKAVDDIAGQYPGVNKDDVSKVLWSLGGIDTTKEHSPDAWIAALKRVQTVMERRQVEKDGQNRDVVVRYLDTRVIREQFDALSRYAAQKESKADTEVERHNQATDQALATKPPPPPPKGLPAAPADERPKEPTSRQEIEDELDQMAYNARQAVRGGV